MPLPSGLNTITVTGTYVSAAGTAESGSVTFTPSSAIMDAAGITVIAATPVTAGLSGGSFAVVLPCTDTAGLVPAGWNFAVNVAVPGAQQTFSCYLPHALGGTVDMTALSPVSGSPAPSGVSYIPNAATVPTSGPSLGGGFLYAVSNALYWLNGDNTPVVVGPTSGGAAIPTGPAGGDLSGDYPDPAVAGVQGTPVEASPGGTTDYLRADGTWASPAATSLPLTTLGDTLYENATPAPARLAGNTSSTKKFYTQTGTGSVSAVPAWGTIAAADVPVLNQNTTGVAANITDTLDQVPAPAANVSLNSHKITSLANGASSSDAAAFGQIPTSAGSIGGLLSANNLSDVASRQTSLNNLAGAVTAGDYLRGNGSNIQLSGIQAGDVPTLNQSTTGNSATATNLAGGATLPDYLAPAVVALTFGSSVTVNAALGNAFSLTLTSSAGTLAAPSNPVDGQVIRFRVTQGSGGSFTLAYNSIYDFGAAGSPTLSTSAAKVDILGFEYVGSISKWCYLGSGLGF